MRNSVASAVVLAVVAAILFAPWSAYGAQDDSQLTVMGQLVVEGYDADLKPHQLADLAYEEAKKLCDMARTVGENVDEEIGFGQCIEALLWWRRNDRIVITKDNIDFFYFAWTESSEDKLLPLVRIISGLYRKAEDEFARKRAFDAAKPIVERGLHGARQYPKITFTVADQNSFGDYDFESKAFPLTLSASFSFSYDDERRRRHLHYGLLACPTGTVVRRTRRQGVVRCSSELPQIHLTNLRDMEVTKGDRRYIYIPVAQEDAESLAPSLRVVREQQRRYDDHEREYRERGTLVLSVDGNIEGASARQVKVRAQKVQVMVFDGEDYIEVGSIDFHEPSILDRIGDGLRTLWGSILSRKRHDGAALLKVQRYFATFALPPPRSG